MIKIKAVYTDFFLIASRSQMLDNMAMLWDILADDKFIMA
jgi:hypothetical protein